MLCFSIYTTSSPLLSSGSWPHHLLISCILWSSRSNPVSLIRLNPTTNPNSTTLGDLSTVYNLPKQGINLRITAQSVISIKMRLSITVVSVLAACISNAAAQQQVGDLTTGVSGHPGSNCLTKVFLTYTLSSDTGQCLRNLQ